MASDDIQSIDEWANARELDAEYDYERIEIPEDKEPEQFVVHERRAQLYQMLREAGHPANMELSQREIGNRFGVSQQTISRDIERLRNYRNEIAGETAVAATEFVAERAVRGEMEEGNWAQALYAQMRYNEFLFNLGKLDREPHQMEISGDGEAYMQMLRSVNESEREAGAEPEYEDDVSDDAPPSDDAPLDGDLDRDQYRGGF